MRTKVVQICPGTPLPTLDELLRAFKPLLSFPPVLPKLPSLSVFLPALPSPLLGSINVPNLELVMVAIELQSRQFISTVLGIIKPVLGKLGISLRKFLPKIPGLPGLDLMDLISGKTEKLIAAVKKALARGFTLPTLPSPIFPTLTMPDLEAGLALQAIISNYMQLVVTKVAGIVQQVTKKFKKMGMPSFPSLPSPDAIASAVLGMIPGSKLPKLPMPAWKGAWPPRFPGLPPNPPGWPPRLPGMPALPGIPAMLTFASLIANLNIKGLDPFSLLSKISFPAMPKLPKLPIPLVPSFKMPEIELNLGMLALNNNMLLGLLKPIMAFINGVLKKVMSFSFPIMCLSIPVPMI